MKDLKNFLLFAAISNAIFFFLFYFSGFEKHDENYDLTNWDLFFISMTQLSLYLRYFANAIIDEYGLKDSHSDKNKNFKKND